MRIFRHCTELPDEAKGGVVVLGNFDGVHAGHQAVIGEGLKRARADGLPCGVMTFEPHPRNFFDPTLKPFRLTPMRIKAHIVEAMGVDHMYVQHFDEAFSRLEAEDFVTSILVACLKVRHVVVGHDYVFGKGRGGDAALLLALGREYGFSVTQVPAVKDAGGVVYSSTAVRQALSGAEPGRAARMLGRFWEIEGRVEHGDARGRDLGFPTANVHLGEYHRPARGVYAVKAGVDEGERTRWIDGAANYGTRPTFDPTDPNPVLEVHLFDFRGDLYHRHLRVALVGFIRPERKFAGLEALKERIAQDVVEAKAMLAGIDLPDDKGPLVPVQATKRSTQDP